MIPSECWEKVSLVWDSIRMSRTDGALVRVSVPIVPEESTEKALVLGIECLKAVYPHWAEYLPGYDTTHMRLNRA